MAVLLFRVIPDLVGGGRSGFDSFGAVIFAMECGRVENVKERVVCDGRVVEKKKSQVQQNRGDGGGEVEDKRYASLCVHLKPIPLARRHVTGRSKYGRARTRVDPETTG